MRTKIAVMVLCLMSISLRSIQLNELVYHPTVCSDDEVLRDKRQKLEKISFLDPMAITLPITHI